VPFWDDFARTWERQKKRKAIAEAMAPITVAVATKVASREFMIWEKKQFWDSKWENNCMNYKNKKTNKHKRLELGSGKERSKFSKPIRFSWYMS